MIPLEDLPYSRFRWLFLAGGIFCLLTAFSLAALFAGKFAPENAQVGDPLEFVEPGENLAGSGQWVVYVTGAVMHPGVYEVHAGSRVFDALGKAGGFSAHADPEAVNLAAKIEDGKHIRIPEKGEKISEEAATPRNVPPAASSQGNSQPLRSIEETGRIDINRASAVELQNLPGIGPKLSQTIVDYRTANGLFETTEDLRKIRGIGEKRYEVLRDLVVVSK